MPPLAERVEQAVATAVAARNGELEQVVRELVRQAVDAELERRAGGLRIDLLSRSGSYYLSLGAESVP